MPPNYRKKKHHKKHLDKKDTKTAHNTCNITEEENGSTEINEENVPAFSETENPYTVQVSEIMGRYLVASRSLKAGDLIIQELPLAIGPCADNDPVCLGCYQPVFLDTENYKCSGCSWPICSAECEGQGKEHGHTAYECAVLREKHVSTILNKCQGIEVRLLYEVILPLRCLLLKQHNTEKYESLMKMEGHNEIRRKIPSLWNRNQEVIVNQLKKSWKITDYTDEEIHNVCGILEVNCFEIGQNGAKARALYPSAFLLSHDCSPNTSHTDDPITHAMTIRLTKPLTKDDPITLSYAYTFQGTLKRREHLQEGKFFWCQCARCSDPTELGTYVSAMRCPKCRDGIVLPTEPLEQKASWKCKSCGYTVNAQSMFLLLEKIYKELDGIDPHDVNGQEEFLEKYRNVLTKNHYLCISAKYSLFQLYGRADGYLIQDLSSDDLKRKEEYCRDVLNIVNVLEPGLSRLRGVIMYELHAPIMMQATKLFELKKISNNELRSRLKEVVKFLKESSKILGYEPAGSSEHNMHLAAEDALKRIGNIN